MSFEELSLDSALLRALRGAGYESPTPIQSRAIPYVLQGRDVLGCAQTGTGKTAAFALPILQKLAEEKTGGPRKIRALVLCPTRELASQILESFQRYGAHTGTRSTVIFGGVNQNPQARALQAGVDVLVATPGRLLDLMQQGFVHLDHVKYLVLDEADRMLDMGFLPSIRRILSRVPARRQSLLFSATMPPPIRELASEILRNPAEVSVARVSAPAEGVRQQAYIVEQADKPALLVQLLDKLASERVLVFTRTKHGADRVVKQLGRAGIPAAALHGNKSQNQRTRALQQFRDASMTVLVATDIAARGLDVPEIAHVINYDLTTEPETYVHRIGRTGRAGATGNAIAFCTPDDQPDLRAIERLMRTTIERLTYKPSAEGRRAMAEPVRATRPAAQAKVHGADGPRGPRPERREHAQGPARNEGSRGRGDGSRARGDGRHVRSEGRHGRGEQPIGARPGRRSERPATASHGRGQHPVATSGGRGEGRAAGGARRGSGRPGARGASGRGHGAGRGR
jgi:ATP-dependent RNA helicase RhlE